MAAVRDASAAYERLHHELQKMIGWSSTNLIRAEVRLWNLLWELTSETNFAARAGSHRLHPAVERTMQTIELRLSEPISVADLARAVDLSHNHLTRLFREAKNVTVINYIQQRRVQRARHLLRNSDLPIKAVARQVGISDLHLFNKTIRRFLGTSPRQFRTSDDI